MLLELVENIALLLLLCMIYSFVYGRPRYNPRVRKIIKGFLFGAFCIVSMMIPFPYRDVIFLDGTSIIMSIAGFLGGWMPAGIAAVIAAAFLAAQGDGAAGMGIAVIASSAAIGVLYNAAYRKSTGSIDIIRLYAFGVIVHMAMVLLALVMFAPPRNLQVFQTIFWPVMLIYPAATVLVAALLLREQSRIDLQQELAASLGKYREIVENANSIIMRFDMQGRITFFNEFAQRFFGYSSSEILGKHVVGTIVPAIDSSGSSLAALIDDIIVNPEALRNNVNENIRRDGSRAWIAWTNRPVFDARGALTEILAVGNDITERRHSEEQLRLREQQYQSMLASSMDGFFLIGSGGELRDANSIYCRMLGYEREELLTKTLADIAAQETPAQIQAHINAVMRAGFDRFVTRHRTKHGAVLDVEISAYYLHLSAEFYCFVRDFTDKKRATDLHLARGGLLKYAIGHSLEELLRRTIDEAEDLTGSTIGFYHEVGPDQESIVLHTWSSRTLRGMCTTKPDGRHYNVAQAGVWCDCLRQRRAVIHNDYAALPHRRGLPPGHAPVSRELVVPVFRGGCIVALLGVGNKPGEYDQGDIEVVSLLVDLAWDVAERKRAVEALRSSEHKYHTVADFTYDWEYWLDPHGRFLYCSPSVERITGYCADEFIADPDLLNRILFSEDRPLWERHIEHDDVLDSDVVEIEFRITTRTNEIRWVDHICRPVFDADGSYLGRRSSTRDITERRRTELRAEASARLIEAINSILRLSISCVSLAEIAESFLSIAEACTGSQFGFVNELNDSGSYDCIALTDPGWQACRMQPEGSPVLPKNFDIRGFGGLVVRQGRSVIVNDPDRHPERIVMPEGHPPIRCFLGVPLMDGQKTFGLIALANKPGGYAEQDARDLDMLAEVFSAAYRHSRAELNTLDSLHEKEVLLREIHHRVKNNLAVIVSMLDLQASGFENQQVARAFDDCKNRIRAMALIHSTLYHSDNLARIHMEIYLRRLVEMLQSACGLHENITVQIHAHGLRMGIDQAIPCGLIVNELFSNAIKYAFPDGRQGSVRIELAVDGSTCCFTFSDDGAGLPVNVTPQAAATFGLQLVRLLSRQLGGTLEIGRSNGTSFAFEFPLKEAVVGL